MTPIRRSSEIAIGLLAMVVAPALARAAEYYVSPSGSDSAAGTTAAPFATLSKANSTAEREMPG
jgi:hypothetical protein